MNWEERYELDRALENLMDKVENSDVTDEQFKKMENLYYKAENWEDYNELEKMIEEYRR